MSEDALLANDVLDELRAEPGLDASRISATSSDGVMTLSGSANRYLEKTVAERAALRVAGVRAIANELTVDVPVSLQRSDQEIPRRRRGPCDGTPPCLRMPCA